MTQRPAAAVATPTRRWAGVQDLFATRGAPAAPGRIHLGRFLFVLAELGLLAIVIRQFRIESNAFLQLTILAIVGFALHAVLPMALRLPFFVALSLTAILSVFGPAQGTVLVLLGLVLIAACHLPIPFGARVAVVLLLCAVLAAQRSEWLPAPWSAAIWPILGSMFMFRLVVYLYDLKHDRTPVSFWRTLGYFFLLPNVCFPLFPVVDYKTFRRNYFDQDSFTIYQLGVSWIVRGVTHLILYRVVYYYLTMAPSEVVDLGDLVQFVVANFLLYLRVSGQFHVIVGILYLFGFRLPETHHRYYLAASFTDFWRRINIYWKDFMQKIFYFPLYFELRKWNPTGALVVSTLLVFFATWLLHAYQWFWLRGSFLLTWPDVTFWAVLAGLVVINVLWETKRGRERSLGQPRRTLHGSGARMLRTAGVFCAICVLWSLWTADSLAAWLALWPAALRGTTDIAGWLPTLAVAVVAVRTSQDPPRAARSAGASWWTAYRTVWISVGTLLLLTALGIQAVYARLGPTAATFINSLRSGQLSRVDAAMLERGYYEDLMRVDRFNGQLWEIYMKKPARWFGVEGLGLERFTGDFRQKELVPSFRVLTEHGAISTNQWGMRDREYAKEPSASTFRVAMLGASSVMGWGVGDGETFESLLEAELSRDTAWEILNLGVPGYSAPQQLATLPKALSFSPDALFYVSPGRELSVATRYLVEVVRKEIPIPYDHLADVVRRAGIEPTQDESAALRRLEPFRGEILSWIYETIVAQCRAQDVLPVYIFLPQVYEGRWQDETPEMVRRAEAAGFVVIDLQDVFAGRDVATVRLAEWDNHPNVLGHRLIAERLAAEIRRRAEIFSQPSDTHVLTMHPEGDR